MFVDCNLWQFKTEVVLGLRYFIMEVDHMRSLDEDIAIYAAYIWSIGLSVLSLRESRAI